MFLYVLEKEKLPAVIDFLTNVVAPKHEDVYAEIYQDEAGQFHLLGADELLPVNTHTYALSEQSYFEFLGKFNPNVLPDGPDGDHIEAAISESHDKIIAIAKALLNQPVDDLSDEEMKEIGIFRDQLDENVEQLKRNFNAIDLENEFIRDYLKKLPRKMLEVIADSKPPIHHSISENKVSALQALQDAIWMAQCTVTTDFLKYGGGKVATALAVTTKTAGIVFGAVTGMFMGVTCGLLSAKIYESRAVNSFEEKYDRPPNEKELKLIQRDAKHVGHSVFMGMTFWSLFAAGMQCALHIAKLAVNFHPAGLVVNLLVSTAAGAGQAIGACVAQYAAEKEKCTDKSGNFDAEKWEKHKTSGAFLKSMVKVGVTSFLAGFAWNMIGSFVPAPLQHGMKTGAEKVAKVFIKMAYRTVAAGLATFGIAYTASRADSYAESKESKIPVLGFLKKTIMNRDKKEEKAKAEEAAHDPALRGSQPVRS